MSDAAAMVLLLSVFILLNVLYVLSLMYISLSRNDGENTYNTVKEVKRVGATLRKPQEGNRNNAVLRIRSG